MYEIHIDSEYQGKRVIKGFATYKAAVVAWKHFMKQDVQFHGCETCNISIVKK